VGITAKYVLFDSWFSVPKTILELKKQDHLDTIAMMKKARQNTDISVKGSTLGKYTAVTKSAGDVLAISCLYLWRSKRMGKDGIEVFFKACKFYLKFIKEYRGISYDTMNAHVAIVFARYMMLSVAQRENNDDKTICEL